MFFEASRPWQVVSSIHGPITTDPVDHFQPASIMTAWWSGPKRWSQMRRYFKAIPELW